LVQIRRAEKQSVLVKFYAPQMAVDQSNGTSVMFDAESLPQVFVFVSD